MGGRHENQRSTKVDGVPITQHWLIPEHARPEALSPRIRRCRSRRSASARRARGISFYSWRRVWARSRVVESLQGAPRVRADLEAVPADVREHRHRDRQRARRAIDALGALARPGRPAAVHRAADAGARNADAHTETERTARARLNLLASI